MIAAVIRKYAGNAFLLTLLCALAMAMAGFGQLQQGTLGAATNLTVSSADGAITVTWTPGSGASSQVIVVVNVADDTDFCLQVDPTATAASYQCGGRTEGETYVVLVIALDEEGGYATARTSHTVPITSTSPVGNPDLVVSTPTLDGDGPVIGATFTLETTVTNRGGKESSATMLRYYRSTEPVVSSADTQVGSEPVDGIAAAGASEHSVDLAAPSEPGTYYYRACVDRASGEVNSTNNCSGVLAVTVVAPDLTVSAPTVDGDNPLLGTTFTMAVTVENQGSGESAATTLRYYSSTDATITTSDTELGTDAVGILAAAGSSDQTIEVTAPTADGTYYYGACVDAVSDESDTGNNCSGALVITLGAPDLVVSTPTASSDSPTAGASFTLSATVRNQGNSASAAGTTLRYYRSTDATITSSDTAVGTDAVSALAAFGTSDQSVDLTAPSDAGTYYYGACADTVTGESSTANNCSDALAITVVAPDLLVGTPTLSGDNPTVGASFTLQARVLNLGGAGSGATTVRFYRSSDTTITTSDTQVGTASVSSVAAEGVSTQSATLTAPSAAGGYHYGACVDTVSGESDTANNCSGALTVTVEAPDLTAGTPSVDGRSPSAGESFTLSATVNNRGAGESGASTLRFYKSADTTITTSDTELGAVSVDGLTGGRVSTQSIDLTARLGNGFGYYGACVDSVAGESDTTNNCSSALKLGIFAPDLVVNKPTANIDDLTLGAAFTLEATVQNRGGGVAAATTLRYYRSTDFWITTSDTPLGTDSVGSLSGRGTSAQSIDLTAPSTPGTYYYGACVDAVSAETDTANNCSFAFGFTLRAPDLVVNTPSVSDNNPDAGETFTLNATVRNRGSGRSTAATLRYYRSTDTTITTSDTELGTDSVGSLSGQGTSAQSIDLTAPSDDGTYYYGACVDTVTGESSTTNNCSSARPLTIGELNVVDPVNNPATGGPAIQGSPVVGNWLGASLHYVEDADGLENATFEYQWIINDGTTDQDISGATAFRYKVVAADEGKTIKVKVSFTDDLGNPEELTSGPTIAVRPNNPATGSLTIRGTARVGETLTADTSSIADADGMEDALSTVDGGRRINWPMAWFTDYNYDTFVGTRIGGLTSREILTHTFDIRPSYVGKTITASLLFVDDLGSTELFESPATVPVAATVPDPPEDLEVSTGSEGALVLTWEELTWDSASFVSDGALGNGGSPITGYKIQWKESADSWDTAEDVSETTVTGEGHTITDLISGTLYTVRVFSRNAVGFGAASGEVTATPD